jgi:hypothetical protein
MAHRVIAVPRRYRVAFGVKRTSTEATLQTNIRFAFSRISSICRFTLLVEGVD